MNERVPHNFLMAMRPSDLDLVTTKVDLPLCFPTRVGKTLASRVVAHGSRPQEAPTLLYEQNINKTP